MKLMYEGKDIYADSLVVQCIYDSYAEQQADVLRIVFNDADDLWDQWNPQKGDRIQATLGICDTGAMYITSVRPENGRMCIRASSIPGTHNNKSNKSWQNVHFMQLCNEIAGRHNLACEFYGVSDHVYAYVNQQNKEDFVFLEERCVLEGCAFLVYDGRLVIYDEEYMESNPANKSLYIENDARFEYKNDSAGVYGKCILKNGSMTGTHNSGATTRTLEKVMSLKISSIGEANRFAKNLLRYENKKMRLATCDSGLFLPEYEACSVMNIKTSGVPSWNGPVFVTHARHDLVRARTKLFFRKPLEG